MKQFATARSIPGSQIAVTLKAYITWCPGKATWKGKIPGSQHRPSNTSGGSSALFIRSIRKSRQQPHAQSTPHHQWLSLQSRLPRNPQKPRKSEAGLQRLVALTSPQKIVERSQKPYSPLQLLLPVPLLNFFFFWFFLLSLQLG